MIPSADVGLAFLLASKQKNSTLVLLDDWVASSTDWIIVGSNRGSNTFFWKEELNWLKSLGVWQIYNK